MNYKVVTLRSVYSTLITSITPKKARKISIIPTNTSLQRKLVLLIPLLFYTFVFVLCTTKFYSRESTLNERRSIEEMCEISQCFNKSDNNNHSLPLPDTTNIMAVTSEHPDTEDRNQTQEEKEANDDSRNSYVDLAIQRNYPFTIATAASENHFCVLQSWIYNAQNTLHELNNESLVPQIIIYDLGLLNYQRSILKYLHTKGFFTELRRFNYTKYPNFWNINKKRGEYAWKAGIIREVAKEFPGIVAWLDSGSMFKKEFLTNLLNITRVHKGFFSAKSKGRIPQWTHPGTFKYFNLRPYRFRNYRNCNGAMIVFDTRKTQPLIDAWYKCALVKDCIAPKGSDRKNHRQDQAVLTLLAAMDKRHCSKESEPYGVHLHQDHHCQEQIYNFEKVHTDIRYYL
ncbi:1687_t:CDS:2 [Ambispora gerdemannii]|uniref:1687_t:CDS:1 n=1 Tax=Ambispora gerdemannii TaxID=144530 RepID=A0A9N9BB79_9GLOM|nr:1687_t:CDS:2 [Ambispora gerdemannii]